MKNNDTWIWRCEEKILWVVEMRWNRRMNNYVIRCRWDIASNKDKIWINEVMKYKMMMNTNGLCRMKNNDIRIWRCELVEMNIEVE